MNSMNPKYFLELLTVPLIILVISIVCVFKLCDTVKSISVPKKELQAVYFTNYVVYIVPTNQIAMTNVIK